MKCYLLIIIQVYHWALFPVVCIKSTEVDFNDLWLMNGLSYYSFAKVCM